MRREISHDAPHGGMGTRGATRPMMGDAGEHDGSGGGMDRHAMLVEHHRRTLWIWWLVLMLGAWLVLAPLAFDYGTGTVAPSGGRAVWLALETRVALMTWSDIASGVLLLVFGWRSLTPERPVSRWICCFVGIWLQFAPLLFWAPTAVAYLNDTLVGVFVIALTVLVPGMPDMILYMKMGPPSPPGWSYNPSSWPQRWSMMVLGFLGWVVSRQLAAYQLGFTPHAWDPFFGGGTERVLNSSMSHSLPVSDAALGAFAYTFEFLMGWMGSPARWRTMPWMVAFFGILVIPLGLVHIFLVISQPVVVGSWCTLCLLAASIMLPMIPLEVDEVIAMGQHLVQSKRRGESLWQVFWKGGKAVGSAPDDRTPPLAELPTRPGDVVRASLWGMSVPWTLAVATVAGLAMMVSPDLFGVAKPAADVEHLAGALIVVVSVIAMGEPVRLLRWVNVPLGLAGAVLPWYLGGATTGGVLLALAAGFVAAACAVPRGPKRESYGSWDRWVR